MEKLGPVQIIGYDVKLHMIVKVVTLIYPRII